MEDDIPLDEINKVLDAVQEAPRWCSEIEVGSMVRNKTTRAIYEVASGPMMSDGHTFLTVRFLDSGRTCIVDAREVEPLDHLSALGDQA